MKQYPKNLTEVEKLSNFFGRKYGDNLETIIAREPDFTYTAFLDQFDSDAPVAKVLFSNLDVEPVFTYEDVGYYSLRHPLITPAKTIVTVSTNQVFEPDANPDAYVVANVVGNEEIMIKSYSYLGNQANDVLSNTSIKIEIWL